MSMKILSPAGEIESLKMAIYNGADEVYLGVKDFNARNIQGFSLSTLKEAVDVAHIFGVKVNLTVNILFSDKELQDALDLIVDAYNLGVDSFIIQDIGLISLLCKYYPEIEIHASTQMGVHNLEGVKEVEKLGVKRVVLARETSLDEIKRIKENSNVEIEYFVHGALCVSFSGNCYLSSYLHNASGNRGKCKQLCRLPYSLYLNEKQLAEGYLLSAKDFNMLNRLKDLQQVGVDVLKIEGRARRPYYVGEITKTYRNALNNLQFNEEDINLAFNRGFTEGYFNGNGNIISNKQNHIGIEIGRVEKFKAGKKFNEIFITSNREISTKSILKFIDEQNETVITAYDIQKVKDLYRITTTQKVEVGNTVNLISDYPKEQELLTSINKRKVEIKLTAKVGENITAEYYLNGKKYIMCGAVCLMAKNQPITEQDLKSNFNKSVLFDVVLTCDIENFFMPKQQINEFRRNVLEEIKNKLLENKKEKINKINLKIEKNTQKFTDFIVICENFNNFLINNKNIKEKNIIYSPEIYTTEDIKNFIRECKKLNKKPYLDLPIFATSEDIKLLKGIVKETKIAVIVNNLYALNFDTEKIVGGGLNVYNNYSASYFNLPYIQAEGDSFKMPYMTLRHCPMKQHLKSNCINCPFKCGYSYKMQNGKTLKLKRKKLTDCTFYLTD